MGWLDERKIKYIFRKGDDEKIIEVLAGKGIPKAPKGYVYAGFVPEKLGIMTKVQFEQNGRIGYRIDVGDGKQIYRSATREKYEHIVGNTGRDKYKEAKRQGKAINHNESQYTKSYADVVKKTEKQKAQAHDRNLRKILKGEK